MARKDRQRDIAAEQSERARYQPRDELGRFASSDKLIVVDESGDMGFNDRSSKTFTVAATTTSYPDEFRAIADNYPPGTRRNKRTFGAKELKFDTSSDRIRREMLQDIANLHPDIKAVVIDKYNMPKDLEHKGSKIYEKAAIELMDDIMKDIDGRFTVIYDPNTALKGNVGCRATKTAARKYGREIRMCTQKISSDRDRALQTNDFVVGAIGRKVNYRDGKFHRIIERFTRIRRIK